MSSPEFTTNAVPPAVARMFADQAPLAVLGASLPETPLVFPGSFNPLHRGHRRMAEVAAQRWGRPLHFEISVKNVDKPSLSLAQLRQRLAAFATLEQPNIVITRAARFVEKSRLIPNAYFVVGADTLRRMVSPSYYRSGADMRDAISELAARIAGLIVFGRVRFDAESSEHNFEQCSTFDVPKPLLQRCIEIPEEEFRVDVSSTAMRRGRRGSN